jgi:hypothetical protein
MVREGFWQWLIHVTSTTLGVAHFLSFILFLFTQSRDMDNSDDKLSPVDRSGATFCMTNTELTTFNIIFK